MKKAMSVLKKMVAKPVLGLAVKYPAVVRKFTMSLRWLLSGC